MAQASDSIKCNGYIAALNLCQETNKGKQTHMKFCRWMNDVSDTKRSSIHTYVYSPVNPFHSRHRSISDAKKASSLRHVWGTFVHFYTNWACNAMVQHTMCANCYVCMSVACAPHDNTSTVSTTWPLKQSMVSYKMSLHAVHLHRKSGGGRDV